MLPGFDHLDLTNPFGDPAVGSSKGALGCGAYYAAPPSSSCYDRVFEPSSAAVALRSSDQDFSCSARAAVTAPAGELGMWQEELFWDNQDVESYDMRSEASNGQRSMVMGPRTQSMPSLPRARVPYFDPAKDGTLPKPGAGVRHAPATLYGGKTEMFSRIVDTTPTEYKVQFDSYMNRDKRAVHFDSYMDRDKQHLYDSCKMSSQRTCLRPAPRLVGDFRSSEAWQRAYAMRERSRKDSRRRQPRQERPCVGAGPSIRMGRRARIYNPAPTPIVSDEISCEPMLEDVFRSPHPNARDIVLCDEIYREQAQPLTRIPSRHFTPEPELRQVPPPAARITPRRCTPEPEMRQAREQNGNVQNRQPIDLQSSGELQLPIPVNVGLASEANAVECNRASLGRDSQLQQMQRLLGETWRQQQLSTVAAVPTSSSSAIRFSRGDDAQRSHPPPICSDFLEVRAAPTENAPVPHESRELVSSPYVFLGRLVATLPGDAPSLQPDDVHRANNGEGPNPPQAVVECNFWQLREASPESRDVKAPHAQRTHELVEGAHRPPPPGPLPMGRRWIQGHADADSMQNREEDCDELPPWPHEM